FEVIEVQDRYRQGSSGPFRLGVFLREACVEVAYVVEASQRVGNGELFEALVGLQQSSFLSADQQTADGEDRRGPDQHVEVETRMRGQLRVCRVTLHRLDHQPSQRGTRSQHYPLQRADDRGLPVHDATSTDLAAAGVYGPARIASGGAVAVLREQQCTVQRRAFATVHMPFAGELLAQAET